MKQKLIIALSILMTSCASPVISFSVKNVDYVDGRSEVKLEYPVAVSKNTQAAELINKSISECLLSVDAPTFDSIILQAKQYAKDSIGYANVSKWSGFSNQELISLYIEHYTYMGGAHGGTTIYTPTYDTKTGAEISIRENITDTVAFQKLLIEQYAVQNKLNLDTAAEEIGYFVSLRELPIPATMSLTAEGIKIYYQQYEIACYAVGITTATIPYSMLSGIFKLNTTALKAIETIP